VRTALAMELVDLAVQAVDGTKVAANASSCRSYDAGGLAKLLERLDRAIAELEDRNEGETGRPPVHLQEELADKRNLPAHGPGLQSWLGPAPEPRIKHVPQRVPQHAEGEYRQGDEYAGNYGHVRCNPEKGQSVR
jgi:hypothetical protein